MREMWFRGKRVDNGEWVYGWLVKGINAYIITSENFEDAVVSGLGCILKHMSTLCYEVDPETVGQYTGIKDKNGKGIYEGDIIRFIKENCLVNFVENDCAFRIEVDGRISTALRKAYSKDYKVIGSIYDGEVYRCLT